MERSDRTPRDNTDEQSTRAQSGTRDQEAVRTAAAADDSAMPRSADVSQPTVRRRRFLAGLSVSGLTALAGCTISADRNGISWGSDDSPPAPTPTARRETATPRPSQTQTATETPEPTATPTPTPSRTATETPAPRTTEQELEVVLAEPVTKEYEAVLAEVTPTPEPVTARFGLYNFRLYVVKAGDGLFEGPNSLELVGGVQVRGFDGRGNEICPVGLCAVGGLPTAWVTQYPNTVDIDEGQQAKQLSTRSDPIFVDFPDFESIDPSKAYIEVTGGFTDDDGPSSMDDLGEGSVRWYLDGPQSGGATANGNGEARFALSVQGDDAHVRVSFDVDQFS